jgi:surface polysaccharide O-acyltransferase-like enzyme
MVHTPHIHEKWPDFVRAIAAYFIVMIHSGAGGGTGSETLPAIIYCSLSKPAVLWFFMLSGYLLIGKHEPLAEFFRKRLFKVIIPLISFQSYLGS